MQLLEQLRTEDPPSLMEIDARIPPDLAAIVERAMRKDPDERFADLDQMRRSSSTCSAASPRRRGRRARVSAPSAIKSGRFRRRSSSVSGLAAPRKPFPMPVRELPSSPCRRSRLIYRSESRGSRPRLTEPTPTLRPCSGPTR